MNRSTQHGVTLISLLIGLVISMIAVLGVTTLFRTVLKNNTEASVSAQITAERASAFLITDMHLHDAGYGVDGSADSNLLLLSSALLEGSSLSGTPHLPSSWGNEKNGNALIWRFKNGLDSTNTSCAGLFLKEGSATSPSYIYSLTIDNCNTLQTAGTWSKQLLLETPPLKGAAIALNFKAAETICAGFGVAGTGNFQVILESQHRLGSEASDPTIDLTSTTCLLNF